MRDLQTPVAIWLTGLPATGKSTVARHLAERLRDDGRCAVVLDSDDLRKCLTPGATYDDAERDRFYAAVADLAVLVVDSGASVILAATAPKQAYRDALRARVDELWEVWLRCPDELLEARDPKGLYAAAKEGRIERLPGRGARYEAPAAPELVYDTDRMSAAAIARSIHVAITGATESPPDDEVTIRPDRVERYLRSHGHPGASLVALMPLGTEVQEGLKAHGYGRPLRVTFDVGSRRHDLVLRTVGNDPFGHDRRADHFDGLVLDYDEFPSYPRHIQPVDLGVITRHGSLHSIGAGEPFLLTEFVEGELYAHDLKRLAREPGARALDHARAEALARYLAVLHRERVAPARYRRAVRDLVGHGEGIFGLVDGYEAGDPVATPSRLRAIEHGAVDWLWRLRERDRRARRIHGDFHPFNLLFREGTDFTVLDASRGGAGDPADDVTALSINYVFFALAEKGAFDGALSDLWDRFWTVYLAESEDDEVLDVVAPYFAWRALVLACPAWYPDLEPGVRDRILRFAQRLIEGDRFTPERIVGLLA